MVPWFYNSMNLVLSGISSLCKDKQAFKMIDSFSSMCFHLLFTVHFEIAFYSQGKKKEKVWVSLETSESSVCPTSRCFVPGCGKSLAHSKGKSQRVQRYPAKHGMSLGAQCCPTHRPLNKKPCCIFPRLPQSVLTFICRALGNCFCQTNQQLLLNVKGYLQIRLDLAPSRIFLR